MSATEPARISSICELADAYPVWFCDVWGVIHNGVERFDPAVDALERFRRLGGKVALITNAPRPAASVEAQLRQLTITRDAYDLVVTSGDVMRELIATTGIRRVYHLGPGRDLPFFEGLAADRVEVDSAEAVVCTGLLDDERESPEDYRALFVELIGRGLTLYCANPDRVVRRGPALFYCAGALADLYREMDGAIVVAGKPHPPIYERALAAIRGIRGAPVERENVLVIGDGIDTDMAGAAAQSLDAVFVAGGIHSEELATDAWDTGGAQGVRARLNAVSGLRVAGILTALKW